MEHNFRKGYEVDTERLDRQVKLLVPGRLVNVSSDMMNNMFRLSGREDADVKRQGITVFKSVDAAASCMLFIQGHISASEQQQQNITNCWGFENSHWYCGFNAMIVSLINVNNVWTVLIFNEHIWGWTARLDLLDIVC
jgi:hypothetical protein